MFKAKALLELREDDCRRRQALEQFREWVSKQGHIENCRNGSFALNVFASLIFAAFQMTFSFFDFCG